MPENNHNAGYDMADETDQALEELRQRIEALEPDSLTPKQALSVLYDLKAVLAEKEDE